MTLLASNNFFFVFFFLFQSSVTQSHTGAFHWKYWFCHISFWFWEKIFSHRRRQPDLCQDSRLSDFFSLPSSTLFRLPWSFDEKTKRTTWIFKYLLCIMNDNRNSLNILKVLFGRSQWESTLILSEVNNIDQKNTYLWHSWIATKTEERTKKKSFSIH